MHAIVRKGNGEYYISVILGCYDDASNDYTHRYFIVLNEEKSGRSVITKKHNRVKSSCG